MDNEEFEERLNKEKSFLTSKNHTAELEKQLEEQKEEHEVRDETEKIKEDIKNRLFSEDNGILKGSDSSLGIDGISSMIMSIVAIGIVLSVGLIVLNELKDASTSDGTSGGTATAASNATGQIITKLATVPTWIGIIIIVALAFIVLSFFIRVED